VTKKLPNPMDMHVGSRVRMRRIMLGTTQEKTADALGLTFQQVQKYEKGTNRISASRLQQLAHILRVPVEFFFDGAPGRPKMDGNAPSAAYVSDFITSPDGIPLIKAFTRLKDANLRRCIVKLVEEIANDDESRR
jgi:transcriptional regulator with XRE-family HTH domain